MPGRPFCQPSRDHSKKGQISKNRTGLEKIEQGNPQKQI